MYASKGGNHQTLLLSYKTYELQQLSVQHNNLTLHVYQLQTYLGGNQQLSSWTQDMINNKQPSQVQEA